MTAQLDNQTLDLTRAVLRDQSTGLVRAEVKAQAQREGLERAVVEAITKLGLSVDEASEASGLTPSEIYKLLDQPRLDEDLAVLAGCA